MTVLQYNTVPAEHQPLVAEAPKKKYGGRVVAAAVAAALLATAVAGSTPVFRAASNLASCMALDCGKTTQLKLDTSNAGQWAPKQPMCISVEDRGKTVPATYYDFDFARICTARRPRSRSASSTSARPKRTKATLPG